MLYPQLIHLYSPAHFLTPVVSYLFVYYMLYPKQKWVKWHSFLFVPFLLHLVELIPFYIGPIANKVKEVELILKYHSLVNYPSEIGVFSPLVLAILKVVFTLALALASFYVVLHFIIKGKKFKGFIVSWMFSFTLLNLLSIVFIIAYVAGIIGFNNLRFSYADLLMNLAAFGNILFVLYRPSLLDGITFQSLVSRLQTEDRRSEPGEDAQKLMKYESYAARLETLFTEQEPFLDSDLTLEKTAKYLQISTKELSRTTAYIYELGYPDFVNSWRINYIIQQRNSDKQWQEYSQDMLAELSGFGSRQGLHNAVNRLHGTTPATFFSQKANKN